MREKERTLAEGAAGEHARAVGAITRANADAPTAYIGPLPTDEPGGYSGYHPGEHGLLSGRDNPDNPGLLSGQQYRPDPTLDRPTTYLPPNTPRSPATGQFPAGGPPTGAWTPDFTGDAAADRGPGTTAWRPDFDDDPDSSGDDAAGRHSR